MAERWTRLDVEDAVQLVQQRLTKNVDQFGAMVADDCVKASIFVGRRRAPSGSAGDSLPIAGSGGTPPMRNLPGRIWQSRVHIMAPVARHKRLLPNDRVEMPLLYGDRLRDQRPYRLDAIGDHHGAAKCPPCPIVWTYQSSGGSPEPASAVFTTVLPSSSMCLTPIMPLSGCC